MMGFCQLAAALLFIMLVAGEEIATSSRHRRSRSRCSLSPSRLLVLLLLLARADLGQRAHLRCSSNLAVVSRIYYYYAIVRL